MMYYIFGFLIGIGVYMIFRSKELNSQVVACVNHKWVYMTQPGEEDIQYLQCRVCKKFPGTDHDAN